MAARSVRAYLHNRTDLPLTKLADECPHGEWTARAPDRVEAHSTVMMRAESILLGGVESRATYQIGNNRDSTVYIHWDNPTARSNSYHTNTGAGYYAFWSAPTSGSDPVAHYVVQPAGRVDTDFLPSRDGFRFDNHWDNVPYSLPPLRGTLLDKKYGNAANGLCGGMVLGALDYFVAKQEIPPARDAPRGEHDPLFIYLVNRLFDTFSIDSVSLLLKLMDPLYPDGDENVLSTFGLANGRAAVMAHEEWPLIRADIDAGLPSPVCIVTVKSLNPGDLGKNHQLLAYAYSAEGHDVSLHLYDPNQPSVDGVYMRFNDGDVSQRIVVEHNIAVEGRPVYCFVRMDGRTKPIPIATRPRLAVVERRARRVHLERGKQVVLSKREVAEGRRMFDVWPDCGQHEFPFVVNAVATSSTLTALTPHYREPALAWTINGVAVPPDERPRFLVPAFADRPAAAPNRAAPVGEEQGPPPGMIALRTELNGNQLLIVNDSADGNYTLVVQLRAQDGLDLSSVTSDTTAIDIAGLDEVVDGLREASAECWKEYLNRHRGGEPSSAGAVAAALFAQLGRPADPLWDPDPDAISIGAIVAGGDPTITDIANWNQELRQGDLGAGHGALGAEAIRVHAEAIRVDADGLREQLQRQLRGIGGIAPG